MAHKEEGAISLSALVLRNSLCLHLWFLFCFYLYTLEKGIMVLSRNV